METFYVVLEIINSILWHDVVLYIVLGTGVLFTIWSGFGQYRALTHGTQVVRGVYDDKDDPGAINHFQALSTALSATVGLGNIGGVAVAISLGGPGAVFWMWMVGIFGMALKMTEVTLSMLYRNTDEKDNPHGGPMWVAKIGFERMGLPLLGSIVGGVFCVTVLVSAVTGGNMFQAWNVAEITNGYFPSVPKIFVGIILAVTVGLVIIGGIKRIGAVAGRLVPLMCVLYLIAAFYVLIVNFTAIPGMLRLIVYSAFNPAEASGAFLGGTAAYAFLWGMKRALFSSEAGQGSAPIAHSAAKTNEPVREGVVAGLEPFIDTIVVCTLTTLVILLSGAWNRSAEAVYLDDAVVEFRLVSEPVAVLDSPPLVLPVSADAGEMEWTLHSIPAPARTDGRAWQVNDRVFVFAVMGDSPNETYRLAVNGRIRSGNGQQLVIDDWETVTGPVPESVHTELYPGRQPRWTIRAPALPQRTEEARRILRAADGAGWRAGDGVFMIVHADFDRNTGRDLLRVFGTITSEGNETFGVAWDNFNSSREPTFSLDPDGTPDYGIYGNYIGAALTGHAFDRVVPGLGMWLVTLACWLFAISTMISWSYYGEQGMIYLAGKYSVLPYKLVYCSLIVVATAGFMRTDAELDAFTMLGTGVMLFANIPLMLIFGYQAMHAYHEYIGRLKSGKMEPPHKAPPITQVVSGEDVE